MSPSVASSMVIVASRPRRLMALRMVSIFSMALGSAFCHPLPAAGAGIAACHLRGHSALIEKNQPLRRDLADGLLKRLAPLLVRFRVAFAGVERLFFSRRPICRST